jgi:hypothetical protein
LSTRYRLFTPAQRTSNDTLPGLGGIGAWAGVPPGPLNAAMTFSYVV